MHQPIKKQLKWVHRLANKPRSHKSITAIFLPVIIIIVTSSTPGEADFKPTNADKKTPTTNYRVEKTDIKHPLNGLNQHAWHAGFSLELHEQGLQIGIKISLVASENVKALRLEKAKPQWLQGIENTWNDRFMLVLPDNKKLPVIFQVRFTHIKPQHRVLVRPGNWGPNQHNWYIHTPTKVVAHEIGHMLGAFDEYANGALSPKTKLIDRRSIMGGDPLNGLAYPRHLLLIQQILADKLHDDAIHFIARPPTFSQ